MILTTEQLQIIVNRMKGVVPDFGKMADATGVSWNDIADTIRAQTRGTSFSGQSIVNFMMLGAAIGHAFAKGERFDVQGNDDEVVN